MSIQISRRDFLNASAAAGGSLLLELHLPALARAKDGAGMTELNAYVRVSPDNSVTIMLGQSEMGQGVYTSLPAIVADELGADWDQVRIEQAPAAAAYRNPRFNFQFTGNAESTRTFWFHLRRLGASAREMLVAAAAQRWGVEADSCRVEKSHVLHPASGRKASFGELAAEAAKLPPPQEPRLKPAREFTLIGRSLPKRELPAKVDGSAVFGIDVRVPGMVHAAVAHGPTIQGRLVKMNERAAKSRPGVVAVAKLGDAAVAVVADTYWRARQGLAALAPQWETAPDAALDQAALEARHRAALAEPRFVPIEPVGDAAKAFADGAHIERDYRSPYQAHAPLEPMNCTAHVQPGRCDIWAPTQGPELAQIVAAGITGLPREQVHVHPTFLGGGFGRRLLADYVAEAVQVSKTIGKPVKLLWSREEDMRNDFFRPLVHNRLSARLDARGFPAAVKHRVVTAPQLALLSPNQPAGFDASSAEGMSKYRYRIPHQLGELTLMQTPVRVSVWRSTGYGPNLFAFESFLDELARAANADPYRYRRVLLAHDAQALAVLDLAADKAGWDTPKAGRGRGIAFAEAYESLIAQVVEVSVEKGELRVERVTTAVDCGVVIDPRAMEAQIESGAVWALGAALKHEITIDQGAVAQSNFHDFPLLGLAQTPALAVHAVKSERPPGGIGELGAVAVMPALANAIAAATGKRLRSFPRDLKTLA